MTGTEKQIKFAEAILDTVGREANTHLNGILEAALAEALKAGENPLQEMVDAARKAVASLIGEQDAGQIISIYKSWYYSRTNLRAGLERDRAKAQGQDPGATIWVRVRQMENHVARCPREAAQDAFQAIMNRL